MHGTAQVCWSHISGEALPVRLSPGQEVPAGSLNLDGLLVVQATHSFQDSTPARIARLTQQAQVGHYLSYTLCSVYATPLWDLLIVCDLLTVNCAIAAMWYINEPPHHMQSTVILERLAGPLFLSDHATRLAWTSLTALPDGLLQEQTCVFAAHADA